MLNYEHIRVRIIPRLDGMNWIGWDKRVKHRLFPGWMGKKGQERPFLYRQMNRNRVQPNQDANETG